MANQNKTDIGLIGLAVMGENLALNMESKGWHVSVYNRTVPGVEEGVVDRFMNGRAKGKNIEGFTDIKAFVDSIAIPRKIMMMVRAGSPVDELMDQLFPLLSPGDILIDGGNSNYEDTNRRVKLAESKGFLFVGSGVSGGEEGALNGASIMPGGSEQAWPEVKPILQSIAAKAPDGTPCCQWVGPAGSGHFVKMIHNGIEYGDMQLIAEAYWVMKKLLDLTNEEMADVFARWNEGKLRSYLIEITANILRHKDKSGGYLIDKILDAAGQKGTGKWSVINAMELGMPLGLIATAVFERSLSAQKDLRHQASRQYQCQHTQPIYNKVEQKLTCKVLENAGDEISRRHGEFIFDDLPLQEIARELSNSFGTTIHITDSTLRNYRVTARFRNGEDLETILSVLHNAGYFNYSRNTQQITITKN